MRFTYVCAPDHALAAQDNLTPEALARHRAIAVADTSRHQPPRSSRVLHNQPLLTVSDFPSKISALERGLGIGTLPEQMAAPLLAEGRLVALDIQDTAPAMQVHLAWRTESSGKALRWLIRHLPDYLGDA